jgi:hypothetical protein
MSRIDGRLDCLGNKGGGVYEAKCVHSAMEDFLCCDLWRGPRSVSFVLSFSAVYIPLRGEKTIKSINQSRR